MKKNYAFTLALLFLGSAISNAQTGDLLSLLGEEETTDYTTATFKTTRIVNGHSIENCGEGVLDFKMSHRFGPVRTLRERLAGIDTVSLSLEVP